MIMSMPHDKRAIGQRELVVMVALLLSLNALAIDGMLPALDEMARELGAEEGNRRQLVVAVYLLANGLGCLVPGAFADRFGRRPLLLFSLASYAVLSLLISWVQDFTMLLVLRGVLQLPPIKPRWLSDLAALERLGASRRMDVMDLIDRIER